MTKPRDIDFSGLTVHVGSRGVNKKNIFEFGIDYADYLHRVFDAIKKTRSELHSFCLMPNHTHFLIRLGMDRALAKIFHLANGGYVKGFNFRHDRSGPLFASRFWDRHIVSDKYLAAAQLYIEANPVGANLENWPTDWDWTSARHFMEKSEYSILTPSSWYLSLGDSDDSRRESYIEAMKAYLNIHRTGSSSR
jgi:putative transposase